MRSKLDSLILTPDPAKMTKTGDMILSSDQSPIPSKTNEHVAAETSSRVPEAAIEVENVERPVDLYKVFVFSFLVVHYGNYYDSRALQHM